MKAAAKTAPESIEGTHQGKAFKLRKRVMPNGELSPFWMIDFETDGKRVRHSSGTADRAEAIKVAKSKVETAMKGRWDQLNASRLKAEVATIGKVIEVYKEGIIARTGIKLRTVKSNISMLRTIFRAVQPSALMEELRSSALTRELLQQYKEARFPAKGTIGEQEKAATTINSTMAQARSIFSRDAMELYRDRKVKLPDLTGFMQVSRFNDDRDVSFRPLAPELLARIDEAARALLVADPKRILGEGETADHRLTPARPDIYLAYVMARFIGMRDAEIFEARWEWIEKWPEGNRMAIVKRSYFKPKQGEGRVTIGQDIVDALKAHGDRESLWIVPGATKTDRFDSVYRDANAWLRQWLPDREKGMHELRKQAGSEVYTREHSISAAAEFLRNKEETCRKHYAKLLVPLKPLAMMHVQITPQ